MAKKPTAGGYVTTRAMALNGVHYQQAAPVIELTEQEITRALAHGWIVAVDGAAAPNAPAADDGE